MKIINLKAENVKKLKAVDITPKDNTVVITGKNGAGKTSVLDSILFALGGKDALKATPKPVRDGQDHARVELDLGSYKVIRTWTKEGNSYVSLLSKENASFPSPQKMLDDIVGRISFDPLEFSRMKPEDQKQILLDVLGLADKVYALQNDYSLKYEERRMVGRDLKNAQGHVASFGGQPDAPRAPVDVTALASDLEKAEENNGRIESVRREVEDIEAQVKENEQKVLDLQASIKSLNAKAKERSATIKGLKVVDVAPIKNKLVNASELNRNYDRAQEYKKSQERVREYEVKYNEFGTVLTEIKKKKDMLIMDAKLPIKGLNIDEAGVTFNGIPFSQLSSAEQLKVSLAIAMATNPKLRVMRILDGSLLDSENMKVIRDMADKEDYQVWIERVEDDGQVAITIEDGRVK